MQAYRLSTGAAKDLVLHEAPVPTALTEELARNADITIPKRAIKVLGHMAQNA